MQTLRRYSIAASLTIALAFLTSASHAQVTRAFDDPRFTTFAEGTILQVGNTLMTCSTDDEEGDNADNGNCASARSGASNDANANNNNFMVYVDADADGSTFNYSTADLSVPPGTQVLWAGLYWGADTSAGSAQGSRNIPAGSTAPTPADRNQALFQTPTSGGLVSVTAEVTDVANNRRHSNFLDVTSQVQAGGSGTYAVANVQAGTGRDRYAGWALIVVLEDPAEPLRNLSVYDGFVIINRNNNEETVTVRGFRTPPFAGFDTFLGAVTYEGDRRFDDDTLRLARTGGANETILGDTLNPTDNFFNSTITRNGTRITAKNPDYVDQLGFDIDVVDASGVLNSGDTEAQLTFNTASSNGETYFASVLTFAVDVFQPVLTRDFTKVVTDLNGGVVQPGDILEYEITFTNTGNDGATDVTVTDPIPAGTDYVDNSLVVVDDPQAANEGTKTDQAGDDEAEYDATNDEVVFRLGVGADENDGGQINPEDESQTPSTPPESATIRYRVQVTNDVLIPGTVDN